jgi:hypothetical protein
MVQLNGTGCEAVGRFAGSLSVTSLGDDVWEIQVQNVTSTVIFDYLYQETGTAGGSGGCSAHCKNGSCTCNGPGLCLCFCLFGDPVCFYIGLSFGVSV